MTGRSTDWPDYSVTTLGSGDLPAGERARGTVGFEIDGPRPTRIVFEDVLGDRLASWTIRWHKTKQTPTPASPFGSFWLVGRQGTAKSFLPLRLDPAAPDRGRGIEARARERTVRWT